MRKNALLSVVVASSLVLVACGGDKDEKDDIPQKKDPSVAQQAPQQDQKPDVTVTYDVADPGDWSTVVPEEYKKPIFISSRSCNEVNPITLASYGKTVSGFDKDFTNSVGGKGVFQIPDSVMNQVGVDANGDGKVSAMDPWDSTKTIAELFCTNTHRVNEKMSDPSSIDPVADSVPIGVYNSANGGKVVSLDGAQKFIEMNMKWSSRFSSDGLHFSGGK